MPSRTRERKFFFKKLRLNLKFEAFRKNNYFKYVLISNHLYVRGYQPICKNGMS